MSAGAAGEGTAPQPEEAERLARAVLDVLSRGDSEAFADIVADEIEIHTSRGVRRGRVDAEAWAASKYDHLRRRYAIEELRPSGDGAVLVLGRTEYVWKDDEELADASPVAIELVFRDRKLALWRFREDLS